jgi:hypothetical protein
MNNFLVALELRRLIKILIHKISSKTIWLMLKTKNFQIIPKNSSWIFSDRIKDNFREFKIINFKNLLGLIFLTSNNTNKCFYTFKNYNCGKKKKSCFFPIVSEFSYPDSIFTFVDMKLIDSYFQLKKKIFKLLPIVFPMENLYGFLLSLSETSILLSQKLVQFGNVHKIFFTRIKNLLLEIIAENIPNILTTKNNNMAINLILRQKMSVYIY